jgi:osmoprotectant transport system substrate-binding protein
MAVLALALAGCSGGGGGAVTTDATTGPTGLARNLIHRHPGNARKTVVVGSLGSPEGRVLGQIYAQGLRAAGYRVVVRLGQTGVKRGAVDGYPDYVGRALTSLYGVPVAKVPKDSDPAYQLLQQKLGRDGLVGLAQTPYERAPRLAVTHAEAAKLGNPSRISDLAGKAGGLVLTACPSRSDCVVPLKQTYGLRFKRVVASGPGDVLLVHTTDPVLLGNKYVVLDDDRHAFPPENVTFIAKQARLAKLGPDAKTVIEMLQVPLIDVVQQELNARVALDGKSPREVAAEYLRQGGFVK